MTSVSRREFAELTSLAVVGALFPGRAATPRSAQAFAFEETTIAQLQDGMKSGRLSARGVAQAYLDRIAALDRKGPTLRAVLEINPEAIAIAAVIAHGSSMAGRLSTDPHSMMSERS